MKYSCGNMKGQTREDILWEYLTYYELTEF